MGSSRERYRSFVGSYVQKREALLVYEAALLVFEAALLVVYGAALLVLYEAALLVVYVPWQHEDLEC